MRIAHHADSRIMQPTPTRLRAVPDPLADFCAERPTPVKLVATPSTPRPRDARAPSSAPVARTARGSQSDTPRTVWAFALGSVIGALLGAIGLYGLATSELPLPAPVAHAARTVVAYGSSLSGMLHR